MTQPCFFCENIGHVSENCHIYSSERSRKEILRLKDCCSQCTGARKCDRIWADSGNIYCPYCERYRKCYFCFSKSHQTFDCPDRFKVSKFFAPNIDRILMSRFVQLLELEERYFLALTYPLVFDSINLQPLKISYKKETIYTTTAVFQNFDLVVADKCRCEKIFNFFERELRTTDILSPLKSVAFRIQHLEVNATLLNYNEFLQLLSPKTKIIKCGKTKFLPNLDILNVFKNAPYLEELDLHKTYVEVDDLWPDHLLRLNCSVKMTQIHLPITYLDFNEKQLADLIKAKKVKIFLYRDISEDRYYDKKYYFEMVTKKMSNFFVPTKSPSWQLLTISLRNAAEYTEKLQSIYFDLKCY